MIQVLIADDERIIREGLAFGVDWHSLDMNVTGLAENGREAYEKIIELKPELVIIDIRMPEMTGLEVVRAVRERLDNKVTFIILSGYNEFSYAQQGMSYGVVEYLLKPTDDEQLYATLKKVGSNIEKERKRAEFEKEMRDNMEKQLPILREHMLKDYISNSYLDAGDLEYYKRYLDFEACFRLVLYQIANESTIEELFSLKSLITEKTTGNGLFMCFTIKNQIILLLDNKLNDDELLLQLSDINNYFHDFYDSDLHVIYTRSQQLKIMPYVYSQTSRCTSYSFYLSDEYIVAMEDILRSSADEVHFTNHSGDIIDFINSGNIMMTKNLINEYFDKLTEARFPVHITRSYLTELYMEIIRCRSDACAESFVHETIVFARSESIDKIKEQITKLAVSIAGMNFRDFTSEYSKTIGRAMKYVCDHLSDEGLTLKDLCNKVLFINVDYFGRIFKKETGVKFTSWVAMKRVDEAKRLIAEGRAHNIFEIAEKVGFGNSTQYFSQVFKRHTGYTPSEYKEKKIYLQEENEPRQ